MNIVLWIIQILLAAVFLFHGGMLWFPPKTVPKGMAYVKEISSGLRRFTGSAEILAGIGLILPALTGILPILTPLAAVGLVIVMAGAIVLHIQRKEYSNLGLNLILMAMAIFVAYGRFVISPF